ncbi:MAG TPA: hypothetical protein ENK53_06955 [Thiotrichales bacterium]|nr:hypothetical protein [Thiotrichales bacterium]
MNGKPDQGAGIDAQRLALLERYMTPQLSEMLERVERWQRLQVQTWRWPRYEVIRSTEGTGFAIADRHPKRVTLQNVAR